ncbi:FadR/GntR family transcriptional regulator [Curtanaerobium respiraculi]|uniref:FadR/GntR family transcriptional regulator n=1 Tax=Curtanaerobium respiraculi TaxID=2949669 RepID=UPI0024B3484E|nr:GntR family transcriptional regulator [Curtanaerobium respiraculi]
MGFQKIKSDSLTDKFIEQIEGMILSGELATGEKLPSSRSLCEMMGISRPVVSAGIGKLESMGFVEVKPRQGTFVSDYRRKGSVETLDAIMRYNGCLMRREEVESLFQVRWALDELAVRLVIERAKDAEITSLRTYLEQALEAATAEEEAQAVFLFYHELTVISQNMIMPLVYHSFKSASEFLWERYIGLTHVGQLAEDVRGVMDALEARDEGSALEAVRSNWRKGMELLDEIAQ